MPSETCLSVIVLETTVRFFLRSPLVGDLCLEAQQRYFSYRAIVVAIVSQNLFVLVFMGYCTIVARYVAKWGIAQMCQCKTTCREGIAPFWVCASLPENVSRDMGYRSDSIAISRDMGPLRICGNGRRRRRSSKDGSGLPPPPQNSVEPLGFCRKVMWKV